MTELEKARQIINDVDKKMAELFVIRMNAAKTVAEYKKEHGLQVFDAAREAEVIKKNSMLIEDETLKSYYVEFIKSNMEISKNYQHRLLEGMRVAFSGVEGAFANIAANKVFPDAIAVPYADFKSAYESVEKGDCDAVILPIENSFDKQSRFDLHSLCGTGRASGGVRRMGDASPARRAAEGFGIGAHAAGG